MPKMTAKYTSAFMAATRLKLSIPDDQEALYRALQEENLAWDSKQQAWLDMGDTPADAPTDLVRIRVWAEKDKVNGAASDVIFSMRKRGYNLVEQSPVYPCRPPKQLEARVYLTFSPQQ